jgi:hypothetical protein
MLAISFFHQNFSNVCFVFPGNFWYSHGTGSMNDDHSQIDVTYSLFPQILYKNRIENSVVTRVYSYSMKIV